MADEPLEGFSPEEMAMLRPPPEEAEKPAGEPREPREPRDSDPGDEDEVRASGEDEGGEADAEEPAQQRSVPHKKFNEERLRRQALERQVAENQQWRQTAEQRLQQLYEHAQRQNQQPRREPPKLQEDPAAYIEMMASEVQRLHQQDYQRQAAEHQQRQALEYRARIDKHFEDDISVASQEIPDIQDAFTYLGDNRRKELTAAGYSKPQIEQIMDADYANTVALIAQRGASPARFFYEAAKLRGYQRKVRNGSNGEHLDRVERGQATSRSLSSVGGTGAKVGRPSLEELAKMPQDEFERRLSKGGDKWFKEMMGG